jgi:endonuclease YncB( thermonuclease family)
MQLPQILIIGALALILGACQASLPNALQPNVATNPDYPSPGTPITLANNPAYPNPNATPNIDPAYPTPAELPTAVPEQPVTPPANQIPDRGEITPPLSTGANLRQPGVYTVKIISVSKGNLVVVSNESSEQMVGLVGIFTIDPAQPTCESQSNTRLELLTKNLISATYTLTVIKPDPNDPTIVIGKIVRHDTIDLGLDLIASGLALRNTDTFDGSDNYDILEAAAKAELLGRWNGKCKFSDTIIGTQQA